MSLLTTRSSLISLYCIISMVGGASFLHAERFYSTNELFMPQRAMVQESLPLTGYALSVLEYYSDNLRIEYRKHFNNGVLVASWLYRYMMDGRLHSKAQVDEKAQILYQERYFYRPNYTLWQVIKTTTTYQIHAKGLYWQHQRRLTNLLFSRPTTQPIAPPLLEFKLDPVAEQQIEEVWQDSRLAFLRIYRHGQLQREREFGTQERSFIERLYVNGVAILEREIVLGEVVTERSLERSDNSE